ncbi:nicotinamide riboside transporter PnuC [Streptomyces sp. V3I8]|uniref:hypothetical protein n=1 Tax=Streptomyces sp. V3I8 TaxID=3042279 RepID=UPI0027878AB2|nr:hypothetical protein [Streptomyces sp. V3I8]MDQ1041449.1 nicotinamide riboside transporter PnuC [Streptomyces sp. V3I8]
MNPAWSYVLTLIGITGLLLAGRKKAFGWIIGFLAQGPWATYGVVTGQHGFVISALAYGYVYALNFWTWRRDKAEKPEELTPEQRLFKLAEEMLKIASPDTSLVDRARYADVLIKFSKTAAAWEETNNPKPTRRKMPRTSRRR